MCLYVIGAFLLIVGFGTSLLLYLSSEDVQDDGLVYQLHHGKRYRRDLQMMGGQMNLLADDLVVWFDGLWQGRSLASTTAAIALALSSSIFLFAHHLPADLNSAA